MNLITIQDLVNLLPDNDNPYSANKKCDINNIMADIQNVVTLFASAIHMYDIMEDAEAQIISTLRQISIDLSKVINMLGNPSGYIGNAFGRQGFFTNETNRKLALEWMNGILVNILREQAMGYNMVDIWTKDLIDIQKTIELLFLVRPEGK